MANKTINDLTALTGVVSADYVAVWDASGAVTRKVTLANIFDVLLGQSNTFTNTITIQPSSGTSHGQRIYMPSGTTSSALLAYYNNTLRIQALAQATFNYLMMRSDDLGTDAAGAYLGAGRNTNSGTPAAGHVQLDNRAGTVYRLWPDASGNLRIGTTAPNNANDSSGTVVGTQTSMADAKDLLGDVGDPSEALQAIVMAAQNGIKRFAYKSGAFGGEEFEGIVTDLAPRYGMDRDAEHPAGKSLNEIQLFGDLIRAVALIAERLGMVGTPTDNK